MEREFCNSGVYSKTNLLIGKSCTIKTKLRSCPECFDDKDKLVQLYIYLKSVPPLYNPTINLSIY